MHIVIRLVCLITLIILLALTTWTGILATLFLALIFISIKRTMFKQVLKMCWRLKWFYLSLIISFGWFNSGDVIAVKYVSESLLPTHQGLLEGLLRALAMVAIVSWVAIVMNSCTREELIAGIVWLCKPLSIFGVESQRFALRLVMTLEYTAGSQQMIKQQLEIKSDEGLINRMSNTLTEILISLEKSIKSSTQDDAMAKSIQLPLIQHPPHWQWSWPLLLIFCFYSIL